MDLEVNVHRIYHRVSPDDFPEIIAQFRMKIHPMERMDVIHTNENVCMQQHLVENVCVLNLIERIHRENYH